MSRVTLKSVASAAGLSVSCAARALKGRPDISAETCERVRKVAESLGYRPDPMLAALAAYRHTRRPAAFQGTLAFLVTIACDEAAWLASRETGDLFRGAQQRAESLGYRMEYFHIGSVPKAHERAWKVLRSRGIRGGIVRSFPMKLEDIRLPFDKFECVNLFSEPHMETISTVSSYHAQSMEIVLQKLLERGYRHPALVLSQGLSEILHHGWQMAFSIYAPRFQQASSYFYEGSSVDQATLWAWAAQKGVDSLIICNSENLIPNLQMDGKMFGEIGVVCMDLLNPDCGLSGIYQDRLRGGAVAVECLHSMLITAQLHIEKLSSATMIPGVWRDGISLSMRPN